MLTVGKIGTATTVVSDNNTAKFIASGSLDVFATPMMIALMELAACDCLADSLMPTQTSVGTQINVAHLAATPLGATVTAKATVLQVEGRKILFEITAHDGVNEIGRGTHERFVVDVQRFMEKLRQR